MAKREVDTVLYAVPPYADQELIDAMKIVRDSIWLKDRISDIYDEFLTGVMQENLEDAEKELQLDRIENDND